MRLPDPAIDPGYYTDLLPKRLLAWVVDLLVTLALMLVVMVLTLFAAVLVFPLVWSVIAIAYRYVLLARHGATLGMMLAALRLRRLDGTTPGPPVCFWHAALYAGSMASIVGQIASVALMLTTPYRQGLNDLILGTTMVHRDPDD
jgi:uncharacterized RDD family membrane protein YckC